ncbi:hypothetical protein OSB04_013060 [Centaurea solstitialis]|uniref:TIR domain-containing protein n=1 Tax=Centaurea solstitialis TaxID=347529 RepID=A0AA38TN64_9ASTR|nr:hypothetical protein OSB04_013060 [Centaurea solstitialis]
MASSSSTPSIHKSSFKYDVFLSFRGEDTRTNFVDHLYHALKRQNIETYKDDKNLQKGNKISKELIQAIEESRFHVIVFSKNYASSSWCLDELVEIMECQKTKTGQTIYPIFYDVEPTHVRKQSGEFGKAFAKHENDEVVEKWREALVEATSFSGRDLSTTADGWDGVRRCLKWDSGLGWFWVGGGGVSDGGELRWRSEVVYRRRWSVEVDSLEVSGGVRSGGVSDGGGGLRWRSVLVYRRRWPKKAATVAMIVDEVMVGVVVMAGEGGSGWRWHEVEFIKLVVKDISTKLPVVNADENLIGMRTRINGVVSSLEASSNDFCMIGITGMGGIGKTTLARAVFDQLRTEFEGMSFVENVREVSNLPLLGLKSLQQQVLRDVLNTQDIIVNGVLDGKTMMKSRISYRKVLVVLDDVDHIDQLKALAGEPNWFMKGSKIIITTRDKQVLISHKVKLIHDVDLLTDEEAICLLSRCAFDTEIPIPGYEELCRQVVSYAAGLPLTITILGSSLCNANENVWIDTLEELKKIPLDGTLQKLEISYMGLDVNCKEIFLDVACLLKGYMEDEAIRVLESRGFHAIRGLSVLEKKSLITISREGFLGMHDHIQEMGRYIVRRSNLDEPRRHTRLWIIEEITEILAKDLGTEATRCIKMPPSEINAETVMKGLGKMENLRVFWPYIYNFNSNWEPDEVSQYFPNSLQYLNWYYYPFGSLPKTFQASNLVGLEMMYSKMEQLWKGEEIKVLDKLRFLDLSHSKLRTFDLGLTPNLEMLDLRRCYDLEELRILVGCPKLKSLNLNDTKLSTLDLRMTPNIEILNLEECKGLVQLSMPREFPQLKSLNLSCPKLIRGLNLDGLLLPKLEYLKLINSKLRSLELPRNLKTLTLDNCDLEGLHSPDGDVKLEYLDIRSCSKLKTLDLGRSPNLKSLFLDDYLTAEAIDTCPLHPNNKSPKFQFSCSYREDLPSSVGINEKLLAICFSCVCIDLQSFFERICGLQRMTKLTLSGSIPEAPKDLGRLQCLEELRLFSTEIKRLPDSICMLKRLKCLNLNSCWLLEELPEDLGQLQCLEELTLTWTQIKHLPDSICMLKHMKILTLDDCMLLEKLPEDLGQLECLEEINLSSTEIKHLPDSICMLKHLKILRLDNCMLLEKLPEDLGRLECLETLILEECRLLRHIPNNISGMKRLKYFRLAYCNAVQELPEELGHIECLKELNIEGTCINHLPRSIFSLKKGMCIVGSRELLKSFELPFSIHTSQYTSRELDELFPFMTQTSEEAEYCYMYL